MARLLLLPRGCFSGAAGAAGREAVMSVISKSSRQEGHLFGAFPENVKVQFFVI